MARRIEIKGWARPWVAAGVVVVALWSLFGTSLFSFQFGFFARGYQLGLFRGGHFERHGVYWNRHDHAAGTILTAGGETLVVDLDARVDRGILVVYLWRWPAFLHDEPVVGRVRVDDHADGVYRMEMPRPGAYVLSVSAVLLRGDVMLDWRVADGG